MIDIERLGFDPDLVRALEDIDSIPTTDPDTVKGIPGRLFIVAPQQLELLDFIIETLDAISPSEFETMNTEDKVRISGLLNNALRVRKNSVSR